MGSTTPTACPYAQLCGGGDGAEVGASAARWRAGRRFSLVPPTPIPILFLPPPSDRRPARPPTW
jgi:hypothetical protein